MSVSRRLALFFLAGGLALTSLVALWPEAALAAEAGEVYHKAFSLKEELFKLINTLIVVAILYKLAAKPLRNYLAERREGIRTALAEAERAREEAERLLEEQRSKVADLEAELARVREMGQGERQVLRDRLEAEQEAQAQRLLEQTRNTIDLETMRARAELQNRAAQLALNLAEEMLRKSLGPEDQKRLVENYLANLGGPNGGVR